MTKKLMLSVISALMLISMLLALASCGKDPEPQHTHEFSTEWATDDSYHWHKCNGEGCTEIKDKAEHIYENGVCVCGKTEPAPSVVYTVTEEEWTNAFGLENPFYFADNYKLSANNLMGESSYIVDGSKVKEESMESGTTEKYIGYFSYEDGRYYSVYQNQSGDWKKQDAQGNPLESMCEMVIEPFLDMSLFTYDEATHTYKCATMSFESAQGTSVVLNNLTVSFENKKAVKFTYDFSFHMEVTLVYGGQSVTLPEIHEHTFATEWSSNETHHWHAATCEHTNEVKDMAEHTFSTELTPSTCTERATRPIRALADMRIREIIPMPRGTLIQRSGAKTRAGIGTLLPVNTIVK